MTNLLSPMRRAVACFADREAAVCGSVHLTYAETWDRCRRLAGALAGLGLQRGDRVAVAAANSHQYLELYQTVPGAGYVVVPLNTRHTEAELRYALQDSGARVLFTDLALPDDIVERVVRLPDGYEQLLAAASPVDIADESGGTGAINGPGPDDLAGLFYTGGTTGAAKGVMLTHGNLVANAFHLMALWPFSPAARWLVAAPLFHAAGTFAVAATVFHGGCHVVLPAFTPGGFLDLVADEQATHTLVVPTMLAAIADEQLARPRAGAASLRNLGHGASPVATEVLRRTVRAFPEMALTHFYGATETAPIATALVDEHLELDGPRARSCGRPAIGVDIAVRDLDRSCAAGEVGEVFVRGANVMRGYWNKPEQTAAALHDGWYGSGDLGFLTSDGCLVLVDRLKDMIVTGGENVYSTEVEEALYRHPGVLEAAVFGVPDERWGEAVHAVVVPRDGTVTAGVLHEHCRALIAGYKVPKAITVRLEALPKSGAGKILKRELREPFWAGHDGRIS